jgi:hypothetical protein
MHRHCPPSQSMAVDNDDGSAYYNTHHNVMIYAASDAAYGGNRCVGQRATRVGCGMAVCRLTPYHRDWHCVAAFVTRSLKSDFGGHDNFHSFNLDLFFGKGFGIDDALEGHADACE